jgi:2-methylcitrate dehydratase PrpD
VVEDSQFDALGDEGRHGVELEVQLHNGDSYSEKVLHAKGSDRHPMTEEEILRKFALLASRVLSSSRVEKLRDTLLNLEKLDDAREIGKLLTA